MGEDDEVREEGMVREREVGVWGWKREDGDESRKIGKRK